QSVEEEGPGGTVRILHHRNGQTEKANCRVGRYCSVRHQAPAHETELSKQNLSSPRAASMFGAVSISARQQEKGMSEEITPPSGTEEVSPVAAEKAPVAKCKNCGTGFTRTAPNNTLCLA